MLLRHSYGVIVGERDKVCLLQSADVQVESWQGQDLRLEGISMGLQLRREKTRAKCAVNVIYEHVKVKIGCERWRGWLQVEQRLGSR